MGQNSNKNIFDQINQELAFGNAMHLYPTSSLFLPYCWRNAPE